MHNLIWDRRVDFVGDQTWSSLFQCLAYSVESFPLIPHAWFKMYMHVSICNCAIILHVKVGIWMHAHISGKSQCCRAKSLFSSLPFCQKVKGSGDHFWLIPHFGDSTLANCVH